MKKQSERLRGLEISFVKRAGSDPGGATADDFDEFFEELSNNEPSRRRAVSSHGGDSMFPLPDQLLTAVQERRLFLQMNSLKCRADALRNTLNPSRPSRKAIEKTDRCLADAKRIRDCLCERNLRLVLSIARKLSHSQGHFEELVSEGLPILLRCIDLFDASRGYRFSTYVTHSVQRHLYRVLRKQQRRQEKQTLIEPEMLQNVAEQQVEPESEIDHAAVLRSIWQSGRAELNAREETIVKRRFGLEGETEQSLRQISGDLGISKERVRQLQMRALEKLFGAARSLNLTTAMF